MKTTLEIQHQNLLKLEDFARKITRFALSFLKENNLSNFKKTSF